jgi:hypothetical protein
MAGSGRLSTAVPLSVQSSVDFSRANSISVLSVAPGFPPVTVVLFAVTMNHSGKPDSPGT